MQSSAVNSRLPQLAPRLDGAQPLASGGRFRRFAALKSSTLAGRRAGFAAHRRPLYPASARSRGLPHAAASPQPPPDGDATDGANPETLDAETAELGRRLERQLAFKEPRAAEAVLNLPRERERPQSGRVHSSGDYQAGDVLGGKYRVVEVIGRGANGVSYKAEAPNGKAIAVKALSLRGLADWKQLELFEREAAALAGLSHPGIPQYLEYFEEDTERDKGFFLVQELAEGRSLAQMVGQGVRLDEAEVTRIAVEVLAILQYLGSRRPPVTHRDVKPENIVVEGGRPGGRVYLVDFGGVQAAAAAGAGLGSTIVGTYGFMAPEQFRGAAQPASDLYALGGTLLFLLTGRLPNDFPQDGLRINFSGELEVGPDLEALLDGLLEPMVEDRLTAAEALALLQGQRASPQQLRRGLRQPAGGRAVMRRSGPKLQVEIPPAGITGETIQTGAFAIAWNGFVAFWTASALAGGGVVFALFSLPFWIAGFTVGKQAFGRSLVREGLSIGAKRWELSQQLALLRRGQPDWSHADSVRGGASGFTQDLEGAEVVVSAYVNGVPQTHIELAEGVRRHVFGEGLAAVEQRWLADEINDHLKQHRGRLPGGGRRGGGGGGSGGSENEFREQGQDGGYGSTGSEFREQQQRAAESSTF